MSASEAALIISTRERVVWTTDEKKLLNRLSKVFNQHGDRLLLVCGNQFCPEQRIILQADASSPGGAVLRCGCSDRIFSPTC